jgi:hypothetical protein
MGRGNSLAKRRDETDLQWRSRLARLKQDERAKSAPIAPPEAANQGSYEADFVTHVETNTKAHTLINRGGSPLCRWATAGKLSATQLAVIALCERLWRFSGLNPRVTANYGERLPGGGNAEHAATKEIEAREDLHRMQGYVPPAYWSVWENIVRHGYAASEAGVGQGYVGKSAGHRAHLIVCFVADIIAMRERI